MVMYRRAVLGIALLVLSPSGCAGDRPGWIKGIEETGGQVVPLEAEFYVEYTSSAIELVYGLR